MLQMPHPAQSLKPRPLASLEEAYELCRQITQEYAKTFYLATLLMPKEKREAIWAIYAWCRRTDELVDGLDAKSTTPDTLKGWEKQLDSVFAGVPYDSPDLALVDTLKRFPCDIQPFKDMIAGQYMDLQRNRYDSFEELKLYCYRVAGTVGLMSNAVLGIKDNTLTAPWNPQQKYVPTEEAIALGIGMQLTNILRDVGEDAERGRIYLPLEDLHRFGYTEKDLFNKVVDDRWRAFMKFQIQRARDYYQRAEEGIRYLIPDSRLPVWSALILYQRILKVIENNDYDVFNNRAYVPKTKKIAALPVAWLRAQAL